jgi:hypothetical protein
LITKFVRCTNSEPTIVKRSDTINNHPAIILVVGKVTNGV